MNIDDFNLPQIISDGAKAFLEILKNYFQMSAIDQALQEGHAKFISNVVGDRNDPETLDFLCGYKKLVKQEQRKRDIASKAFEYIKDNAHPEKIDEDWLEFFFEKAKLVSNKDMQLIWAKLLAEEANEPGKISPSLLHTISVMRYEQAEFFCHISRFALKGFKEEYAHLLLFVASNREVYEKLDITPRKLKELERLGLVECDFDKEYVFPNKDDKKIFASGNKVITVYGDPNNQQKIKAGNVEFTQDGQVLYSIIDSSFKVYNSDIFGFIVAKFRARNCQVSINDTKLI